MTTTEAVERGRECFRREEWGLAYTELAAADRHSPLSPDDLERLGLAAYLVGRDDESAAVWTRAYHGLLDRGDQVRAASCAFWLGWGLFYRGQSAQSSGWFARAHRLVDECGLDCVAKGLLLVPLGYEHCEQGDLEIAGALYEQAGEIGERLGSPDVVAFSRLGRGEVLIRSGDVAAGVALLDEVMVAAISGELSPMVTGTMYCAVLIDCQEILDVARAREWTAALDQWCASHPDLVPFRGQCLVHRSEVMLLGGAWSNAMEQAEQARELLSRPPPQPAVGMAFLQQAELHRLRGEFDKADETYREASHRGTEPQPGLALLRLAQGELDASAAAVRRVLDEAQDPGTRSRLLPAYIEIMLAVSDVGAARQGADELAHLAGDRNVPFLSAVAAHALGAVLLAEGDVRPALDSLRRAWGIWRDLDVPYEVARVRVQIGLACRALGDGDSAEMELEAAGWVFRELGAAPDLARVEALSMKSDSKVAGSLTEREVQVLRLVAAGKTNHAIAADLQLSDHTVRRHLQNTFDKLGVSSRAAATAFALQHDLI